MVSMIEYLHTTISVSGPTIFCHFDLMAARIWGVSSLDGSLSNASTLAASSNSSDDLSRSPSCRIALSTVVCDSPSGSISVVVSPSCNWIFYTHFAIKLKPDTLRTMLKDIEYNNTKSLNHDYTFIKIKVKFNNINNYLYDTTETIFFHIIYIPCCTKILISLGILKKIPR